MTSPRRSRFWAQPGIGTRKPDIVEKTVAGGHIGLFMGARTLKQDWPEIARWIAAH